MAWAEDVKAEFFRSEDFADDWTVNGVSVRAIFDDAFVEDLGIEGTSPQIMMATTDADLAAATAGDAAVGPQGSYVVRGFQSTGDGYQGKGTTTLILEEA